MKRSELKQKAVTYLGAKNANKKRSGIATTNPTDQPGEVSYTGPAVRGFVRTLNI